MATALPEGSDEQPHSFFGIQRTAVLAAESVGKCDSKISRIKYASFVSGVSILYRSTAPASFSSLIVSSA